MKIHISSEITIDNPTASIKTYLIKHLTFVNTEYTRRARMGLWLGRTPAYITLYRINGNTITVPYGMRQTIEYLVGDDCEIESDLTAHERIAFNVADMGLRDYQNKAVDAMIANDGGILNAPAGSGKTQMGLAIALRYGTPTLWLTHTKDLANQTYQRALKYIDKSLIGRCEEGKIEIGKVLTIAVVNTLSATDLRPLRSTWDTIIVDECHRVAGSLSKLTMFMKVVSYLQAKHKFGLSATLHRADGLIGTTYALLGDIAYTVPQSAVEDYLMPIEVKAIPVETEDNATIYGSDGKIVYSNLLSYLSVATDRNLSITRLITDNAEHSFLVLSERLDHLKTLISFLPKELRDKAVYIDGTTDNRDTALDAMRDGRKKYLFASFTLAKEGLDIPCLDRLIITSPVKDEAVVEQAIGRIARKSSGKADAIVFDIVDTEIPYCERAYKTRCRWYRRKEAEIDNADMDYPK